MSSSPIFLTEYSVIETVYSQTLMDKKYKYDKRSAWESANATLAKFMERIGDKADIRMSLSSEKGASLLYDLKGQDVQVYIGLKKKDVSVDLSGHDEKLIDEHMKMLQKSFPPIAEKNDRVKIRFWYNTNQGPTNVTRSIVIPEWKEIRENYEASTLDSLEYLMNDFRPSGGGQLIIFHGPPGTGKSYSLRALLDSWRKWAVADYVLDPEQLFSGTQGYLASLVLRGASDEYEYDEEEGRSVVKESDKWKLLILEDSGELLSADAKARTGQGLSRLLNLVDGLIGQGLRVLVLITTNEDLEKLHPAVSREGRCAAAVKFKPLSVEQATKWVEKNAADKTPPTVTNKGVTLADLYAHIRRDDKKPRKKLVEMDLKEIGFKMR